MKELMKRIIGLSLAVAAMAFVAGVARAGIAGSAHDFSDDSWNSGGQICKPCHVPHNPNPGGSVGAPLWNHTLTTQTFTMYPSGGTIDGTIDAAPSGVTKLCLSCHDGVTNLDAFGGAAGATAMTGAAVVGTNLSNDHPVSITYNTADTGLESAPTDAAVKLFGNKVECASCHDVHNAGIAKLLVKANSGSALCLACHKK
jgi:predicted CXXCH cytochrome family protein